ncbi:hypothetical protein B0H14DRAFT_3876965 [Mycena olivaceomarginata]|nr:hypothetical protein B0H14DRAFT_3876965 [Mycena olivaceomarginata]
MARAPTNETTMFKNWDKFDLIVVYDQSSQTLGGRIRRCRSWCGLISETAFTKLLKCMPMALVGEQGTAAAKAPISFTSNTGSSSSSSAAAAAPMSNGYSSVNGANGENGAAPMVNGFSSSSSSSSSTSMTNGFAGLASTSSSSSDVQHQLWTCSISCGPAARDDRPNYSLDQSIGHSRSPAEITYPTNYQLGADYGSRPSTGSRGPTLSRAGQSAAGPSSFAHGIPENYASSPPPLTNGTSSSSSPITYPSFTPMRPSISVSPSLSSLNHTGPSPPAAIASPPLASINPTLSRRRSDYVNQSAEAVSSLHRGRPLPFPRLPVRAAHPASAARGRVVGTRAAGPAKGDESLCLWRARDWCWWKWKR